MQVEVRLVQVQSAQDGTDLFAEGPMDWIKKDMNSIIQTLVLGGVAILAILLVIRPLVARAIESAEIASKDDELDQLALVAPNIAARLTDQSRASTLGDEEPEEDMINIDRIQGRLKSSSYNKINAMIEKHPDETAQIFRQWLSSMN